MKVHGPLEQAGYEVLTSLPADVDSFPGRIVALNDGNIYTYFEGEWKLTGSLTQAVKTQPSIDPADDAGDILGLDTDGKLNSGFLRDTDKLPDQSGATDGQVLTTTTGVATWEDPAGGGGGLEVEYRNTDFTAEFGKHYLVDTGSNIVNVTLPSIAAVPVEEQGNAKCRFSDEGRSWHVNSMNLIPASGDKIYDADVDETYECDVMLTWVQIQRSADTIWNMDHVFQPIENPFSNNAIANDITSPTYTFVETDLNALMQYTENSANNIDMTIPAGLGDIGDTLTVIKGGTGDVNFLPDVGVTINGTGGATTMGGQYSVVTAIQRATNIWVLTGERA